MNQMATPWFHARKLQVLISKIFGITSQSRASTGINFPEQVGYHLKLT